MKPDLLPKRTKLLVAAVAVAVAISLIVSNNEMFYADADNDGISDTLDNCPNVSNPLQTDFDKDMLGNECDLDDDNDKVVDEIDVFDFNPNEWLDTDSDGSGNNADKDDDNDKVIDAIDAFDTNPSEWADFDFDGTGTIQDQDDDNDGILDLDDPTPKPVSEVLATKYLNDIEDCALTESGTLRLLCYSDLFDEVVEMENNNANAIELSISLSKLGTVDDCHFISHQIGHSAFEENPNVIENLMEIDGTLCRGGFYHGTLASYFHNVKESGQAFPDYYKTLCNELIGSSNYQDCIHGLGHGLVHYYLDDLKSSVNACNQLSFYQSILCIKGVMMQYTDNILTRKGISEETMSNLCSQSELNSIDFQQCAMSIGSTLAFHTNHILNEGTKSCDLIKNEDAKAFCREGLRLEIEDSEKYKVKPLTKEIREKYQPQFIKQGSKEWIVDIRSPALISDFAYNEETKMMMFSFDKPTYIIMYIPNDLLPKESTLTVNAELPNEAVVDNKQIKGYTAIRIVPETPGIVQFTPT